MDFYLVLDKKSKIVTRWKFLVLSILKKLTQLDRNFGIWGFKCIMHIDKFIAMYIKDCEIQLLLLSIWLIFNLLPMMQHLTLGRKHIGRRSTRKRLSSSKIQQFQICKITLIGVLFSSRISSRQVLRRGQLMKQLISILSTNT